VRDGETVLLLDCGFTVPHRLFAEPLGADELGGVWISHLHGDHSFGLPLLLLRLWEMGRRRTLVVAGPPGLRERLFDLLDQAYPGFTDRLGYRVSVQEVACGQPFAIAGVEAQVAATEHGVPNLALRLTIAGKNIFYSGDGRATEASIELASGCDLVVHEAFTLHGDIEGHGAADELVRRLTGRVGTLAMVHVGRGFRPQVADWLAAHPGCAVLPDDDAVFCL